MFPYGENISGSQESSWDKTKKFDLKIGFAEKWTEQSFPGQIQTSDHHNNSFQAKRRRKIWVAVRKYVLVLISELMRDKNQCFWSSTTIQEIWTSLQGVDIQLEDRFWILTLKKTEFGYVRFFRVR
jgi:hypothetical protein